MSQSSTIEPQTQAEEQVTILRLLISCADQPGIVAAIATFLSGVGANIVSSSQYSNDPDGGHFFMRLEFSMPLGPGEDGDLQSRFGAMIAERFGMTWRMWRADRPKRIALLVSREDHCLLELLWRWRRDELAAEIGLVASNHPDLRESVENFDLPYHHIPVEKGRKAVAEAELLELLAGEFDLIVLARYMQIVSGDFLERVGAPVINIHHSFLPAFVGAGPYQRAKERGVKLVGATSHYVTEDLDAGPIIEQDVIRVSHAHDIDELIRLGALVERSVLARAVRWHCEDRVLIDGNTTVVL